VFQLPGSNALDTAEAIRRWGMTHQDFRARSGTPDIAADPRAVCGAGIETQ